MRRKFLTEQIGIRIDPARKKHIRMAAEKLHLTLSEFVIWSAYLVANRILND